MGSKDRRSEKKGSRKKKPIQEKPRKDKGESNKANVGKNNVSQSGTFTNTNISCYRCGKNHLASKCTLDRNVKCNYCGTPGHLRKVCMGAKRASANQVEEILNVEHWKYCGSTKFFKTLTGDRKSLRFEIDSGAAVSILSTSTVRNHFPHRQLQPTTVQSVTFCKTAIKVIGVFPVSVA